MIKKTSIAIIAASFLLTVNLDAKTVSVKPEKQEHNATSIFKQGFEEGIKTAMSILNSVKPNIQVVKKQNPIDTVKHGHWIHGSSSENIRVTCSECGYKVNYFWDSWQDAKYCPHCGAKMDGKEE